MSLFKFTIYKVLITEKKMKHFLGWFWYRIPFWIPVLFCLKSLSFFIQQMLSVLRILLREPSLYKWYTSLVFTFCLCWIIRHPIIADPNTSSILNNLKVIAQTNKKKFRKVKTRGEYAFSRTFTVFSVCGYGNSNRRIPGCHTIYPQF